MDWLKENINSTGQDTDDNNLSLSKGVTGKIIIGREEELQALEFYMSAAADGQGSFILVNGEAGVGKSFLIKTASRIAVESGFLISEIDFKKYPGYEPYVPFIDLVQSFEGKNDETGQLLSQLKTITQTSGKASENESYNAESFEKLNSERTILQQLIVGKLLDASRKKPVFLFLNNLHVVSQTTLQFIHYLTAKFTDNGIMICAALRQDGEETAKDKIPVYADILKRM
ncbi:MAG: ATP-binding protein, partial [Calditrichaceae bacterium]